MAKFITLVIVLNFQLLNAASPQTVSISKLIVGKWKITKMEVGDFVKDISSNQSYMLFKSQTVSIAIDGSIVAHTWTYNEKKKTIIARYKNDINVYKIEDITNTRLVLLDETEKPFVKMELKRVNE